MEIVVYSRSKEIQKCKLISAITKLVPSERVCIYHNQHELTNKLIEGVKSRFLLIVLAESIEDIVDIYFLQTLLVRHRVFLIAPDKEKDSIALASRAKARVIGCMQDKYFDMASFLEELSVYKIFLPNIVTTIKIGTTSLRNEPAPIAA